MQTNESMLVMLLTGRSSDPLLKFCHCQQISKDVRTCPIHAALFEKRSS